MKKFANVDKATGEILGFIVPSTDNLLEPVQDDPNDSGREIREVPADMWQTCTSASHWFDGSNFRIRKLKPSVHHNFSMGVWGFDSVSFEAAVRKARDEKLTASDWTQIPDAPLTPEERVAWATYRQQLRDITTSLEGIEFIQDVSWPQEP